MTKMQKLLWMLALIAGLALIATGCESPKGNRKPTVPSDAPCTIQTSPKATSLGPTCLPGDPNCKPKATFQRK